MSRIRRLRRRALAVLLGLAPFLLLELGLRVFDPAGRPLHDDPLAGFGPMTPLFVRDGDRYVIDPPRLRYFAPAEFPVEKSANTRRIFVLGGSTVQGRPWSTPSAFPKWMQLTLQAAAPERNWEVINCGGISYASYRVALVLDEILRNPDYRADAIVLCTGHNEFLEDREYGDLHHAPSALLAPLAWLARTRTAQLALQLVAGDEPSPARASLAGEVDTVLDHEDGLSHYEADPSWRRAVVTHFQSSMQRMVRACREHRVPLLLIDPPANLIDCPPFKSAPWPHPPAPVPDDVAETPEAAALFAAGVRASRRDFDPDRARQLLVAAKDFDVCPLRILESQRAILRGLGTPLLDAHALLEQRSRGGIAGSPELVDHVHPSIEGHQRLGKAIALELLQSSFAAPDEDGDPGDALEAELEQRFAAHYRTFDTVYFQRAQLTLEQLQRWAAGRVGSEFEQNR